MIVSGRVVFDQLGRTIEQYYPTDEGKGALNFSFNNGFATQAATVTTYDVLNRTTSTTLPDNTTTAMDYSISDNRFVTTVTDALTNSKTSYRDVRELITAMKEEVEVFGADGKPTSATEVLWTRYEYDGLNRLNKTIRIVGGSQASNKPEDHSDYCRSR